MEHYFLKGGFSLFTYIGERNWSGSLREVGLWRQDRKIICCCSSVNSCLTLCDPVDCSRPGFPVLHCLLEFAQTHVHWVSDANQPSHPLSSPSPPVLNLSQHQSFPMSQLFTSGGQSIGASGLAPIPSKNIQAWFPLGLTGLISLKSWDSQESSPTPQFKSINSLVLSFLYGPTLTFHT